MNKRTIASMTTTQFSERVTCSLVTPQNEQGRAKLIATITSAGIQVWCKYCHGIHLVKREECLAMWEQGG